ncbi:MAG: diaminopimelate decarboxylase [Candidatus Aminicenantes bacterium]|jgi:diaminopimelate decarboxylase
MHWWENNFLKAKKGKLYLGKEEASRMAEKYGTPLFIYSQNQILTNLHTLRNAFEKLTSLQVRVYYAMKANPHSGILKALNNEGVWIDAVSPGEINKALKAGFSEEKIFFTGTSVSSDDLREVYQKNNLIINIDAEEQLELMKEIRDKMFRHKKFKVAVRWNPGIGRGFDSKAVTAGERSYDGIPIKFGIEEKKVIAMFSKALHFDFIPKGLHQHLGSGWTRQDLEAVKKAVDKMISMASEIQNQGFELEFLDFGGGFAPRYSHQQDDFPVEDYAQYICQKIKKSGLKIKAIAVEPGKFLVGNAGILLVRVEYLKKSYNNTFACVNAGTFNTVPRPAIYSEAHHHIVNCSHLDSGRMEKVTVAGNLCEAGDIFGKEMVMPLPKRGDILAVLNAGAYCSSMASNFNLRDIPKEILI